MRNRQAALLTFGVLAVGAIVRCAGVPLTAPGGSNVWAQVNPPFVIANGGTAVVTALITAPNGNLVPNGTNVYFFTNLGHIDDVVQTRDGMAHANFVADSRSGTATISVWSGGAAPVSASTTTTTLAGGGGGGAGTGSATATGTGSATVTLAIGSALPAKVIVTANPDRITSPRRSTITANVFDGVGNPIQNVPVVFTITAVSGGGLEETLASGGVPQYTDSNGQAFDTLITRAAVGGPQKTVTVTATPAGTGTPVPVTVYID